MLAEAAAVVGGDSDALMEAAGASPPFPLDLDAGPGAVDMAVLARIFTERPFQPIQVRLLQLAQSPLHGAAASRLTPESCQ